MASLPIARFRVLAYFPVNNYTLIYFFFTLLCAQMMLILLLLFQTQFRRPVVVWLDELKKRRAQLVVKSVSTIVLVAMIYSIYSVADIRSRSVNAVDFPNHAILALEASLMGFSLFLLLATYKLHEYIKELVMVAQTIETVTKQSRDFGKSTKKKADEANFVRKEIFRLKTEIKRLESEYSIKNKAVQLEKADSSALKDTLEGLVVEYDRLLADNKDLRDQLEDMNEKLSQSSGNKSLFFSWGQWGL